MSSDPGHRSRDALPFQLTVSLGAYLLFLVQPLVAKQILPWFGGAPAVWSTCLLFFQVGLLAGYAYAHLTRRLGRTGQITLHVVLLTVAVATLPIVPSAGWKPDVAGTPVWSLLGLLATTVGVPYFLLAATAPLVQDWYTGGVPGKDPYHLYVFSNVGSLAALLSYPSVVEPLLFLKSQAIWWSIAFAVFVIICAWCGVRVARGVSRAIVPPSSGPTRVSAPSWLDRALWVALSACGSGLLLATTNQLCQDVAVVPLLWIAPLAVYLVTFILSFAGLYSRVYWAIGFVAAVAISAYALAHAPYTPMLFQAGALLFLLATGCMVCHGELVHLRPEPERLTAFYLGIALGGSLGGIFVALAAPVLFVTYAELPFLILTLGALLVATLFRDFGKQQKGRMPIFVWVIPMIAFCIATGVVLSSAAPSSSSATVSVTRNFYGILRVVDDRTNPEGPVRTLYHGRIMHGAQFVGPSRAQATTYFAEGSGVEIAIRQHSRRLAGQPMRIGIVGLGAGTIAVWGETNDRMRFFEINPEVSPLAHTYFTFLKDSRADVDIVLGDARLSLEREMGVPQNQHTYDVFVVDAFSGDAIPVHLLTRESFALYWQALAPDGVLALHISNQYLDLGPVVRGLAAERGLRVVEIVRQSDPKRVINKSDWMLVAANDAFIGRAEAFAAADPPTARQIIWTDSFSSLLSVLR